MKKKTSHLAQVSLTFGERLRLLQRLPEKGSLATMRILHELQIMLSPQDAELKRLEVKPRDDGSLQWNGKKDHPRPYGFEGWAVQLIVARLQALDKEEELTTLDLPLWDKFVGPKGLNGSKEG